MKEISIGIYYYIDEETDQKVYDVEYIREEFESRLEELLNQESWMKKHYTTFLWQPYAS